MIPSRTHPCARRLVAALALGLLGASTPLRAQAAEAPPPTPPDAVDAPPMGAPPDSPQDSPPDAADTAPAAPTAGAPPRKDPPPRVVDETALERHRTPVAALNEHFLGSASRAVRFNWRESPVTLGAFASELLERNNFGQWRVGALGRKAFGDVVVELGLSVYFSYATLSSETLALTPFRQAGRPMHGELDLNVGYAVAEGVVTPLAAFVPPAEMVFVVYGGFRYLAYVESFPNRPIQDIGLDLVSPALSELEQNRIEENALGGMLVDPGRMHTMVGVSLDTYFQPGVFISPRAHIALPLVAAVSGSDLGFFWELSIAVGYAL